MPNVTDTVIVGLVPAVVEAAKRAGLPVKYAGIAAILVATALVALSDLADASDSTGSLARWVLSGLVLGLAGVGLYSQAQRLPSVQRQQNGDID
jgi:Bacteriophage A118-like holin, Hol118